MSIPTLLEQERTIIRTFKQVKREYSEEATSASTILKQEEATAAAKQKETIAAAEQARDGAMKQAGKEISLAREYLSEAQKILGESSVPQSHKASTGANEIDSTNDQKELGRRVEAAFEALQVFKAAAERRATQGGLWTIGAMFAGVIVGTVVPIFIVHFFVTDATTAIVGLVGGVTGLAIALGVYMIKSESAFRAKYEAVAQAVASAEQCHSRYVAQIQATYQSAISAAQQEYQEQSAAIRSQYQQRTDTNTKAYQASVARLRVMISDYTTGVDTATAPWLSPTWKDWQPSTEHLPQNRIGAFQASATDSITWPAVLPFPEARSLLIKSNGAVREKAVQGVQSLLLRLLATIPPGKLRFTFLDPVGLGQNAAPFMHLSDHNAELVTSRAWSEPQHIEQRLVDLTEHISNVIQKYLRNQFQTIEAYNANVGEIAEPYRVLVVFDFPTNLGEDAARRLVSIAQNGTRCGVYTIVVADTEKPLPHGFSLADLEQVSEVISASGDHFIWDDDDFRDCLLMFDTPPEAERFDSIVNTVGKESIAASKVEVPFARIAPPPQEWWTHPSNGGLEVPLGPSGARKVQQLVLGHGTTHHALIAGRVGSGKSTLLHTVITGAALTYAPEELELYLVDFKQGVEFKVYATNELPHARVIAVQSEREFGLSVLQGLDAELKRRGDRFRAAGQDNIADYRKSSGETLPRILLLVDEFQEFFTEDDPIAAQSGLILDRLVRQGRAYGIHVVLGSQTLAGAYTLARSTIDQMAVRIALQCSEADSRLILADDNPAARLLSRPGEAIYNSANGLIEGNNTFQVAWLPDDQRDEYLGQIREMAKQRHYAPSRPQIVFEGNEPADIAKNGPLSRLIAANGHRTPEKTTYAWLGEPIAIRDPVAAPLRRQSGSNLLIVGHDEDSALGMMTTALVSLAAQMPQHARNDSTPSLHVLEFGAIDGPNADVLASLAERLPCPVMYGRRRQLPDMIAGLAGEVQRRLDEDDTNAPAKYLLLYGLHRARDLRQEETSFSFSAFGEQPPAASPAQQFATVLREGPDVGIHTLIWCDTMTNLDRTLDRRSLREFAMRVAFQMSPEDSANFIDSPAASKLAPYRALFQDEDAGRLDKFRPYSVPPEDWLSSALRRIRAGAVVADS